MKMDNRMPKYWIFIALVCQMQVERLVCLQQHTLQIMKIFDPPVLQGFFWGGHCPLPSHGVAPTSLQAGLMTLHMIYCVTKLATVLSP